MVFNILTEPVTCEVDYNGMTNKIGSYDVVVLVSRLFSFGLKIV